jgi:hypothetical protein
MSTVVNTPRVAGAVDLGGARLRVPWATVLPLAVVAAFGSTFWIIAIRGAVGAVERTAPAAFPTWLRESTLLLPLYVFAVLGALTLALRWFRGDRPRMGATVAVFLLVVAAVTAVGTVVLVANAVYDYHLQSTHLVAMNATHGPCNVNCVASRQHDAYVLQVRAIAFGSALMLVSNLVLLGLLIAFRGGRLNIVSARRSSQRVSRFDSVELFLLAGLLGTAVVHATLVAEQLAAWPEAGIVLLLLVVAEVDAALLFLLRLRSVQYVGTAVVSAVPLLVWLYSRTAGLPFGPEAATARPVGLTDTVTALLEMATLVVALAALRSRKSRGCGPAEHPVTAAIAAVVAVTVAGAAVGVGLLGKERTSRHQPGDHIHATAALRGGATTDLVS